MPAQAPPGSCTVIGAGLAGSAVAESLARRGWAVQVLEAGSAPACGASSLPVGMLAPHVSADDNLFSRLSRAGARMTWQAAERLIQEHRDWELAGTLEVRLLKPIRRSSNAKIRPTASSDEAVLEWDRPANAHHLASARLPADSAARWHQQAGWIKPGALVRAFLDQPGVVLRVDAEVSKLVHQDGLWHVLGSSGECLAISDVAVIAAGPDSDALWDGRLGLVPVHGMVSWGLAADLEAGALPPFAVNGNGSLIPSVPSPDGPAWFLGASYHRNPGGGIDEQQDHKANLARLATLLPKAASALAPQFAANQVNAWSGIRATTPDHLPLAGPVEPKAHPGLWLSTGMGSRGLTFAVLCAELIAAQLSGEVLPIPRNMAVALAPRRHLERLKSRLAKLAYKQSS